MMKGDRILLAGCGILKKEVNYLIQKNGWEIDTAFFDSALHCDFNKLETCLTGCLAKHKDSDMIILYGACHPLMEKILNNAGTIRTEGQNCVEQLLGKELFTEELLKGAFFLLEDWAKRWDYITSKTYFRCSPEIEREIFQYDRKYFLALRTICSGDFTNQAEEVADRMEVPLRWMNVSLDHLELVLKQAIDNKMGRY
ncbi:MAG: DUF1638 domain-containing protein [Spirochaetales bacterium]|nr:DUF1638 domain-containing protein [Spirochaetales bacterium]